MKMKWLITAVAITLFTCSGAMAAPMNFQNMVANQGLEQAVTAAMAEGMNVNDIMIEALAIEGINPVAIMTALLNGGAALSAVMASAGTNDISPRVIATVKQKFTNLKQNDTQAFTPAQTRRGPAPMPTAGVPGGGGGTAPPEAYASPSS